MRIFPPEDALEAVEIHSRIDLAEFRSLLILAEGLAPRALVERGHRADDGLPLDDRQARVREARDAAHDDHREHEQTTGQKPPGHRRPIVHSDTGWVTGHGLKYHGDSGEGLTAPLAR